MSGYVELAQEEGGKVIVGGERLSDAAHADGFYFLADRDHRPTNESRTAREEIFGPVETVLGFDTEDEALRMTNDSPYGLAGILFTQNLDRARIGSLPDGRPARCGSTRSSSATPCVCHSAARGSADWDAKAASTQGTSLPNPGRSPFVCVADR